MDSIWLNTSWLINFIPWWMYVIAAVIALALTWQMWWAIWLVLPLWMKVGLVFIGVSITLYIAGKNAGAKTERDKQREREAGAVNQREQIDATIRKLDDAALQKRLDRWTKH